MSTGELIITSVSVDLELIICREELRGQAGKRGLGPCLLLPFCPSTLCRVEDALNVPELHNCWEDSCTVCTVYAVEVLSLSNTLR